MVLKSAEWRAEGIEERVPVVAAWFTGENGKSLEWEADKVDLSELYAFIKAFRQTSGK